MKHLAPCHSFRRLRASAVRALTLAALLGAGAALPSAVRATTYTWNDLYSSFDDDWSYAGNWTNGAPVSSRDTDIVFAGQAYGYAASNEDIANPFTLHSFSFASGGPAYNLSGGTLSFQTNSAGVSPTLAQNSASNVAISNPIALTNSLTFSGAGAGTLTLSGVISGGGHGLAQTGSGTTVLTGANTFTGFSTLDAGTLSINADAALGAVPASAANNLYFGYGTASTGTLQLAANAGGVTLNANRNVVLQSGIGTFDTNGAGNALTVAGTLSGAGGLAKAGAGTLTLTGANTYTGGTAFNAGTLNVGSAQALGTSGTLSFAGGTLQYSASNTSDYSSRFSTSANQAYSIDTNGRRITYATGLTSSGGSLTKLGTGTLTLTGTSSVPTLTVNAGTLQITSGGDLPLYASPSGIKVGAGATFSVSGTGKMTAYSGSLAADGTTANPATVTLSDTGSINVLQGFIGVYGAGTFTQSGGTCGINVLTLGEYSGGSGTYNLNGGTLEIFPQQGGTVVGGSGTSTLNLNGGTLQAGGANSSLLNNLTTANVRGSSPSAGAVIDTNGYNVTIPQALTHSSISGDSTIDGGLTKNGAGTLTLTGVNTYTGETDVTSGGLTINGMGAIQTPNSEITVSGGASLIIGGNASVTVNSIITLGYSVSGGDSDPSNPPSYLTLNDKATLILTDKDGLVGLYAGSVITQNGGILDTDGNPLDLDFVGSNSTIYSLNGGTLSTSGVVGLAQAGAGSTTLNLNGGILQASGNSTSFLQNIAVNVQSGKTIIDTQAFNITIGENLLHDTTSGAPATDGGLTKLGSGTLTLTGNNTYTGGTTFAGGVLNAGSAGALGTSGALTFSGGTLQFSSANTTDYSARFSTAANQAVSLDTNGQNVTLGTGFGSSGTSLTKLGAGTLTINGGNTYTGTTAINGGVLLANNERALGSGGTITFGGGTLQYGNHTDAQFNAADFSGRFSTAAGQAYSIDLNGHSLTYATGLTSSGGTLTVLDSAGGGTLTLTGANTYAGATTISAGTLQIGNGGTSGSLSSGAITNNASLVFNHSDAVSYSGVISGTGSVIQAGKNTLTLGGMNTYSGGTTVAAGTLVEGSDGALGSGNVSISSAALNLTIATGVINAFGKYASLTISGGGVAGVADVGYLQLNGNIVTVGFLTLGSTNIRSGVFTALNEPEYISGPGEIIVGNGSILIGEPSVPEPGTWAFLLAGMGGLAWVVRRRGQG